MLLTTDQTVEVLRRLTLLYPQLTPGTDYVLTTDTAADDQPVSLLHWNSTEPAPYPSANLSLDWLLSDDCAATLPAPPQTWTAQQLWDSFSAEEQTGWLKLAAAYPETFGRLHAQLTTRGTRRIHSTAPELAQALDALAAAGHLTPARRDQYR